MKVNFLTSGFPNGLTTEFTLELNKYLPVNPSFVFIASDFSQPQRTQYFLDVLIQSFRDKGLVFKTVHTIDFHVTPETARELIYEADVIWIAGGPTLKQINYIKQYELIPNLLNRNGITIGMSAGSINMAKRAILVEDTDDNVKTEIYEGIGLVDLNIEPHLNYTSIDHIKNIEKLTMNETIIGLYDNSFIVLSDDKQEYFGKFKLFQKKES
jgi:dipeptidase E